MFQEREYCQSSKGIKGFIPGKGILLGLESKAVITRKRSNIIRVVKNKAVIPRKGKDILLGQ